jgi:AbrB family looped-hinge helix DNA binding protein
METTRLSSKGQVILPKSLRDAHHWTVGTEFEVEDRPEGILLRPKKPFPATQLGDVIGCAGYTGPAKSLEEMDAAIAQAVSERHALGRY